MTIRILIVDDHPIVRHGMAQLINQNADTQICCEAGNPEEALAAMRRCNHNLVIVDISLEATSGLALIKTLLQEYPQLPILVMSMHDESLYAERALRLGAKGYIMKSHAINHIQEAIRTIYAGNIYLRTGVQHSTNNSPSQNTIAELTDKELEILQMIGQGLSTKEIADATNRSMKTIESHRDNVRRKLNLKSGAELLRYAALWLSKQYSQKKTTDDTEGYWGQQQAGSVVIRVALVEDNVDFQKALAAAIHSVSDMTLQAIAGTRAQGLQMLEQDPAEVLVVDLHLPDGSGIDVIRAAQAKWPDCNIMVSTAFSDELHVMQSIEAGASGYLLKDSTPEKIVYEIRNLHSGGSPISPLIARQILQRFRQDNKPAPLPAVAPVSEVQQVAALSPQEKEVLELITRGFSLEEIAGLISVPHYTVLGFVRRIYKKLDSGSNPGVSTVSQNPRLTVD